MRKFKEDKERMKRRKQRKRELKMIERKKEAKLFTPLFTEMMKLE